MKLVKRFLSLVLVICLVLGVVPMTQAAMTFTDVSTSDWFYDEVEYVSSKGMMNGDNGAFDPNGITTRGMIVTVLHRLEGTPSAVGVQFPDVPVDAWYADAVAWASANGIVLGNQNGCFNPGDPITREQLASILFRYAQYKGYDVSVGENTNILSYDDALDVSDYAFSALQWACGAGLINGIGTALVPQGNAARCQVAAILMRLCENVAGEVEEDEEEEEEQEEEEEKKEEEKKPEDEKKDDQTDEELEDLLPNDKNDDKDNVEVIRPTINYNPEYELPEF